MARLAFARPPTDQRYHIASAASADRAGNLVTRSSGGVTWAYGYGPLDRLMSVRRNSVLIARYGYDVLGRRIDPQMAQMSEDVVDGCAAGEELPWKLSAG